MDLPSKWATVSVSYGEGKKHLCSTDCMSFQFHATKEAAEAQIKKDLSSGDRMIALLQVNGLFKANVTVVQIA